MHARFPLKSHCIPICCVPAGGRSEVGSGAEATGDRDAETATGDGGTVSPERDGLCSRHFAGQMLTTT